jgi:hypothetical protein
MPPTLPRGLDHGVGHPTVKAMGSRYAARGRRHPPEASKPRPQVVVITALDHEGRSHQWPLTPCSPRYLALGEEDTVLLAPEHGNQIPRRVGLLRLELEAELPGGPADGGFRLEERPAETLRRVLNLCRCDDPIPRRRRWSPGRERRGRSADTGSRGRRAARAPGSTSWLDHGHRRPPTRARAGEPARHRSPRGRRCAPPGPSRTRRSSRYARYSRGAGSRAGKLPVRLDRCRGPVTQRQTCPYGGARPSR